MDLTFQLLLVLAPIVILSGIANIWGAVLNAGERFALVALAPIITPVVAVAILFVMKSWGIFALAVCMVIGAGFEMLALGIALKLRGISLRPRWHGLSSPRRQVAGQFGPRVGASMLRCGTAVVDRSLAAMLPSGSVATLNYGDRVTVNLLSVVGAALGSALTPHYSRMASQGDWQGLRDLIKRYSLLLLLVSIPLVVVLSLFAKPIVQLVFQRGSFSAQDTQLVAHVQAFYALQIPFYLVNILVSRLLGSLLATHIMMWGAALNLSLNIVLDVLLIRRMGVAGIAMATSCASFATCCFLFYFAIKLLRVEGRRSAQSKT